jgi:triphosphoribosyl-dephospho-CoA synthase
VAESFSNPPLSIGHCATFACVLEATAPKPGNVHRGADFEDLKYSDLIFSAVAIGPAMETAVKLRLGETILSAVRATQAAVGTNSNLGTILLLAPLAAAPRRRALRDGAATILQQLDAADARSVYEAIRLARPGGMGTVDAADIAGEPPDDLRSAMRLAAERDLVARQYANGFREVFDAVVPTLAAGLERGWSVDTAIVHAQLTVMSRFPDSLIARKCGTAVAQQASDRAATVLECGSPDDDEYWQAAGDLDFWLRADGHRRNPGTTADLLAAGLFVLLRDGIMRMPFRLQA